jgi:hypothetical protein
MAVFWRFWPDTGSQGESSGAAGAGGPAGKTVIYTSGNRTREAVRTSFSHLFGQSPVFVPSYEGIIEAMDAALEKQVPDYGFEFFYGGLGIPQGEIAGMFYLGDINDCRVDMNGEVIRGIAESGSCDTLRKGQDLKNSLCTPIREPKNIPKSLPKRSPYIQKYRTFIPFLRALVIILRPSRVLAFIFGVEF